MDYNDNYFLNKFFNKRQQINPIKLKKINNDEINYLLNRFNDNYTINDLKEILYRIKNNICEIPKCKICGKNTRFRNNTVGYSLTCSKECNYKLIFTTYKQTCLEKYGVDNPAKSELIKEKYKQTCLEKYGVDNSAKSELIKEKTKQTCLKKYNQLNGFNKEKAKQTYLLHFGVDHNFKSKENREKAKQTSLKKFGNYNNLNKRLETNLKRYGGKSPMHSKQVQENFKKSLKTKYGYEHALQNPISYQKMINSKTKNNTWCFSLLENKCFEYLQTIFDKNDIFREYRDIRYKNPKNNNKYRVDFYIKSIDLFIEIQGFYSHGTHEFNCNDENDIKELEKIKNKTNGNDLYNQKIICWTYSDPIKRNVAKENNLNYIEAWNFEEFKNKLINFINENK